MATVRVASVDAIAEGSVSAAMADDGRKAALVRVGEKLFALDDRCPHAGGPLSEGALENGALRCPWHARHFDPATGRCVDFAATKNAECFAVEIG